MHFLNLFFLLFICALPLQGAWYDVCIDPGHCGVLDPGALGVNGSAEPDESDFNLDIALVCYADLNNLGWSVILTRHTENYTERWLRPWHKAFIANGIIENDYGIKTDFPVSRAVSIHNNSSTNPNIRGTETYCSPTNSGEDTSYVIFYARHRNSGWKSASLYETYDSILSVSFAIDPLDTGWVVFNTFDGAGNNRLRIGKFYTQTMPESLENVLTLDTYTGYGVGTVGIKTSDRSLHIVYEKNGRIMYLKRDNLGNWTNPFQIWVGHHPSLSIAGDLVHLIWERWYPAYTKIQTCYTDGRFWSRIQDITTNNDRDCFPYMEKGSVAIWQQKLEKQWEIYVSYRNEFGGWTTPQNISQTLENSKYPQVGMYQTTSQTRFVYVWTEGNSSPYEVKILPVSAVRPNPMPLYAFDLGEREPSVFTEQRTGYIIYGQGFEKSVDYDTVCLKYRITGLDSDKIYLLGLAFYQDESNEAWKQNILFDNSLIETINLQRRKLIIERFFIEPSVYSDGVVELGINNLSFPKAVLSGFVVYEFLKENGSIVSLEENQHDIPNRSSILMVPNPAKGRVQIHYQLPEAGEIIIKIYSETGRLVRLISEWKMAGFHVFVWDRRDNQGKIAPSGVYFVQVETQVEIMTGKIVLLR